MFRVTTACHNPMANSEHSEPSETVSTLDPASDVAPDRLLSVKGIVDTLSYTGDQAGDQENAALKASIAQTTATHLSVAVSKVTVDFMRAMDVDTSLGARRRLSGAADGTGFVIMVKEDIPAHHADGLGAAVQNTVSQETGDQHSVTVHDVATMNMAAAPTGLEASHGVDGSGTAIVQWDMMPLHDCAFLAYRVLVAEDDGQEDFGLVSGCDNLLDMMATTCTAHGLQAGMDYNFKVQVLCANTGANSKESETYRMLSGDQGQCSPIAPEDFQRLQDNGWSPRTCSSRRLEGRKHK
jgi:hypothetical protein